MSENETVHEICVDMRDVAVAVGYMDCAYVKRFADRIEAAHKRALVESDALRGILRKLLVVAKNRMPSQPTVYELEVMAAAEIAVKLVEADNG